MVAGGIITEVEPDLVESCIEVAVIVTGPAAPGAVNNPVLETVPAEAVHAIAVLKPPFPCTLAEHWSVWPASADGVTQLALTEVTVEGEFPVDDPPHPTQRMAAQLPNISLAPCERVRPRVMV